MTRRRQMMVVAAALLASAAGIAETGADAGMHRRIFAGVVADVPSGVHVRAGPVASAAASPLEYFNGPVLHANRTHLIFWQPSGSGLSFDAGYQSLIETFLAQVAADSHRPTNVYAVSGQYHDSSGPAAYDSSYGGAVLDSDSLPVNGCTEPPLTGPGWTTCLSASQLDSEVRHVVAADHLPTTNRDVYFLVTPKGLGSCEGSGPRNCALGGSASGYCGYHTVSSDGSIRYAVIPYNAVKDPDGTVHCQSQNPRPNSSTADPTLSTISHEHNEMVTDPFGDAWLDSSGEEEADKCITSFGPILGGSGSSGFNQLIHGGHYFLQDEWSNDDGGCASREEADPISASVPGHPSSGRRGQFVGHARDPDGAIVGYDWFFGDGRTHHGRIVHHKYRKAGTYRLVLRSTDTAGLWAFAVRTIQVS
jgi:PKD domain